MTERASCHDCGVKEGQIHDIGCDMESCPYCGKQLITCEHFLTDDDSRIPYIRYPNVCAKCGVLWPELFNVPDEEWSRYVEPQMRKEVLCRACYEQIKQWIDEEGK